MTFPRKILVSRRHGAGWSTWAADEIRQFMAEYEPIIEFIEDGNEFPSTHEACQKHPLMVQLLEDARKIKPNLEYIFLGGAYNLYVKEVNGPYRINEHDGAESVELMSEDSFFY